MLSKPLSPSSSAPSAMIQQTAGRPDKTSTTTITETLLSSFGGCPEFIVNYVDAQVKRYGFAIQSMEQSKSAQQQVFILNLSPSASSTGISQGETRNEDLGWKESLVRGRNKIVVRIWKAGARWWNLHQNQAKTIATKVNSNHTQFNKKDESITRNKEDHKDGRCYENRKKMHHVHSLARSEVHGYRLARRAFLQSKEMKQGAGVYIPTVLHYEEYGCHNDGDCERYDKRSSGSREEESARNVDLCCCWAVLEYVGPTSTLFGTPNKESNSAMSTEQFTSCLNYNTENCDGGSDTGYDNEGNTTIDNVKCFFEYDSSYLEGMIVHRHEFGFEEPHPRWGRVPVGQALEYAKMVLFQVTLPLHRATSGRCCPSSSRLSHNENDREDDALKDATAMVTDSITFNSMVNLYQQTLDTDIRPLLLQQGQSNDGRWMQSIEVLDSALARLHSYTNACKNSATNSTIGADSTDTIEASMSPSADAVHPQVTIPPLAPVLVHMDLQPQNLLLARRRRRCSPNGGEMTTSITCGTSNMDGKVGTALRATNARTNDEHSNDISIRSVLDWEEAAIADPRFDLLLLCRKVCANREQADNLWMAYQNEYNDKADHHSEDAVGDKDSGLRKRTMVVTSEEGNRSRNERKILDLGPIDPWLQLETVHSITTLLLQSLDLLGGGRNPWETKSDLWGKLEREFQRLKKDHKE